MDLNVAIEVDVETLAWRLTSRLTLMLRLRLIVRLRLNVCVFVEAEEDAG